jgi:hypothetical protein
MKETAMTMPDHLLLARTAILTLAEVKAATTAFDDGEINVFDALDAIGAALDAFRAVAAPDSRREAA